jgi:hypothetical protein
MASQLSVIEKKQLVEHKLHTMRMGSRSRTRIRWRNARKTSGKLPAAFMAENASDFGSDVEFMFDKKITIPLSKMMISRFRQRVQGTLDSFLR